MAALKLVGAGGPRAPERDALAAEIAEASEFRAKAEATRAGIARARLMIDDAQARLSTANADAANAKGSHAERAVAAAATGVPLKADGSLRDARQRAADATDDLEASEAALASFEATLEDEEYRERKARERCTAAADIVLQSAPVETMLKEAETIQADLVERRNVLILLTSQYRIWRADGSHNRNYASDDKSLPANIDKFLGWGGSMLPTSSSTPNYDGSTAAQKWLKAREALTSDPDAPLPMETHK